MKPSQAAQSLADAICAKIAGSICYGIDDETNVEIARLIDEHVKDLRSELRICRSAIEEEGLCFLPYEDVDAALKPWTEPAE